MSASAPDRSLTLVLAGDKHKVRSTCASGGSVEFRFGRGRFTAVAASDVLRRFPQVCLPLWEPFVLHRKHCALAASSDESSGCDVDAAGVASGWLPSAAMVEEAKASSSSVWCIVGSMLDGLLLLACVRDKAKESDGRTKRQARRSHWRARTLQSPQGGRQRRK